MLGRKKRENEAVDKLHQLCMGRSSPERDFNMKSGCQLTCAAESRTVLDNNLGCERHGVGMSTDPEEPDKIRSNRDWLPQIGAVLGY